MREGICDKHLCCILGVLYLQIMVNNWRLSSISHLQPKRCQVNLLLKTNRLSWLIMVVVHTSADAVSQPERPWLKLVKKWNFCPKLHLKNVLRDLKLHRRKLLVKKPSCFWENHFLWGELPRFEKTWSHTVPHTHALFAKGHGEGWH